MGNNCDICVAPLVFILFGGCASVVCPIEYPVSVSSNVKGARVTIYNRGKEVETLVSPAEVKLSPKSGYFVPASYSFVFQKEGYADCEIGIHGRFNGWYVGNAILGIVGVVGALFVDPVTGAMWRLEEKAVVGSLKSLKPEASSAPIKTSFGDDAPSWMFNTGGNTGTGRQTVPPSGRPIEINQIPL